MVITWKDKVNPKLFTEQIEKLKTIKEDGNVAFQGFGFGTFTNYLYNCLSFPLEISEIDARQMITKGIFNVAAQKKLTPENFLQELEKLTNKLLSLPLNRYVLVTLLSISKFTKLKRIHIGNSRIIFENQLSKNFDTNPRISLIEYASKSTPAKLPEDYSYVRIFVSSRSIYDAANQALENLDLIRGIWNYIINRSFSYRKTYGGKPNPINKIILGPIHTVHHPKGSLASDKWWYEPNYFGQIKPYNPNNSDLNKLKQYETYIRRRIHKTKYSSDISYAFIRYSRALDERDYSSAYLKLWSILELLTNSTKGTSHEVTIKRVASIYKERDFHLQVLRFLKNFRNSYVHHNKETNELETYLVQLKNYVESLLQFHITNKFNFKSIQKAAEFFDITCDERELNHKLRLYNYAKRFRNY